MFVTFKDHEGETIAINTDKVLFARPSKLIGIVEVVMSIDVLMNGSQAISQHAVKGSFKEVISKLNNEPSLELVN